MKYKKYRNTKKEKKVSFVKFFNIFNRKGKRENKKYIRLFKKKISEIDNYCDVVEKGRVKFLYKKLNVYNYLQKICNFDYADMTFYIKSSKKTFWLFELDDNTDINYEGQPCGFLSILILYKNKYGKVKNLNVIYDAYN